MIPKKKYSKNKKRQKAKRRANIEVGEIEKNSL
jgi:hypothetical protein